MLKAPIEFYQSDELAVFVLQPDPALKAEVALWLLSPAGQAYGTKVDLPIAAVIEGAGAGAASTMENAMCIALESPLQRTEIDDNIQADAQNAVREGVSLGEHRLPSVTAFKDADASTQQLLDESEAARQRVPAAASRTILRRL